MVRGPMSAAVLAGGIEDQGDRELDEGAPQRAAARSTVRARSVADATPDDRL
jgi:hypothetical protein